MLQRRVAAGGVLIAVAVLCGAGRQATQFAASTPASRIAEAKEAAYEEVRGAMEEAAASMGLALDTSDLVFLCRGELVAAAAGAARFGAPSRALGPLPGDLLGLIYVSKESELRFGDGQLGTRPPGFHAVRVAPDAERNVHDPGITILEVFASTEDVGTALPVELLPGGAERAIGVCLEVDPGGAQDVVCFSWIGPAFGVRLCVEIVAMDGGGDPAGSSTR